MNSNDRAQLILELLEGKGSAAELAARNGLEEQELLALRDAWLAGARAASRTRTPSRRLWVAGAVLGAALLGLMSKEALAATCAAPTSFSSLGLNYFCPNDPALASEFNANTAQLVGLIQQKVGAGWGAADAGAGTSGITTSSATVAGASTLTGGATIGPSGTINFGNTTRQMLNLWGNAYGVGVQSGTMYFRSGGNFAWYVGGSHSDTAFDSGGGTEVARLTDGSFSVRGLIQTNNAAPVSNPQGLQQLIVEATPASVGVAVPINVAAFNSICRDEDGCSFTIAMLNYDNTGVVASRTFHLFLPVFTNEWRMSNDAQGTDGNNAVSEFGVWDCYFGDFNTSSDTNNGRLDNGVGFGVLNLRGGTYPDGQTVCRFIFRD